jgi:hypothetical protein
VGICRASFERRSDGFRSAVRRAWQLSVNQYLHSIETTLSSCGSGGGDNSSLFIIGIIVVIRPVVLFLLLLLRLYPFLPVTPSSVSVAIVNLIHQLSRLENKPWQQIMTFWSMQAISFHQTTDSQFALFDSMVILQISKKRPDAVLRMHLKFAWSCTRDGGPTTHETRGCCPTVSRLFCMGAQKNFSPLLLPLWD